MISLRRSGAILSIVQTTWQCPARLIGKLPDEPFENPNLVYGICTSDLYEKFMSRGTIKRKICCPLVADRALSPKI